MLERFGDKSLGSISEELTSRLFPHVPPPELRELDPEEGGPDDRPFSTRLITGIAAERYFAASYAGLPEFAGHTLRDVTSFGCGFDFRLDPQEAPDSTDFLAVEVKGLAAVSGGIMMTDKEYRVATRLRRRYFLGVVVNFAEAPEIRLIADPAGSSRLDLRSRTEIRRIRSWHASISG